VSNRSKILRKIKPIEQYCNARDFTNTANARKEMQNLF
jgi:hypothetical protein